MTNIAMLARRLRAAIRNNPKCCRGLRVRTEKKTDWTDLSIMKDGHLLARIRLDEQVLRDLEIPVWFRDSEEWEDILEPVLTEWQASHNILDDRFYPIYPDEGM